MIAKTLTLCAAESAQIHAALCRRRRSVLDSLGHYRQAVSAERFDKLKADPDAAETACEQMVRKYSAELAIIDGIFAKLEGRK